MVAVAFDDHIFILVVVMASTDKGMSVFDRRVVTEIGLVVVVGSIEDTDDVRKVYVK